MGEKNWLEFLSNEVQEKQIMKTNQYTERYGLSLSETDVRVLMQERNNVLKTERRIEFGKSILPKIIDEFCDSAYISQDNYVDILIRLQEIFYLYKNETMDEVSDDELLHFMKEQFETICYGDVEYLEGTCLEIFAEAVRSGYQGYQKTEGYGEFGKFDLVKRWDKELYLNTLKELLGR